MLAVNIKNVSFSYRNQTEYIPILNNINLEIKRGEFVAIQGPSGSGKSTLLYLLGCLLKPDSGTIEIMGQDIASESSDDLAQLRNRHLGFIFQHFHLLPRATVLNNILLPVQYSNSDHQEKNYGTSDFNHRAEMLARSVGLQERLDFLPNQLSGGQQQRVAIARALMNDPAIILADEPTGSLDSKTSKQIIDLLRQLHRESNKTIIVITHDNEVAAQCDRIIRIKDGSVNEPTINNSRREGNSHSKSDSKNKHIENPGKPPKAAVLDFLLIIKNILNHWPSALVNLRRNQARTILTMLGISVGVASVLAMLTLGQYTKNKILSGYAEMGVNTLVFRGYPNWDQKATDPSSMVFQFFNWERDLEPLKRIFPQIELMSPQLSGWNTTLNFGGLSIDNDVRLMGVNENSLAIARRKLILGRNFNSRDVEYKNPVCILGYEIAKKLFSHVPALGQVMRVTLGDSSFGCHVIGVLDSMTSNKEWAKPNLQVYLPFTFFQAISGEWWASQIKEVLIQLNVDSDIEKTGKGIKAFFQQKYGASGDFRVDSDSILLAQMKRFLGLFTILLGSIAFITLTVGGIGITNMMLVSVSERFREIGLRKAIGATDFSIRMQFLTESLVLCTLAGFIGLVAGFLAYHGAIAGASKFVNKLSFEWTIDGLAFFISIISIFGVGILSGLFPALKAEKLQVIEALRSE